MSSKQRKHSLVKNASILMTASIISRIIGLLYRRPLGTVLGSVGLGYYGYASNLYAILLLISSYSIPMAVSKMVSERLALGQYKGAQKVFRGALLYAIVVGGITALIAFFLGGYLLPANQQNALPALRVLGPTIFFSAILGVFRGYFQAHQTMTPTSISQIAEQLINAVVSVLAAWMLIRSFAPDGGTKAAIFGSVGGTLGTGAGVLAGLLFMLFVYALNRKYFQRERMRDRSRTEESYGEVFQLIFLMITPIIFTTFVNNASAYLDSYLFAGLMGYHGTASETISAAYGEFSNYYMPIINIPLALASASASAMMPEVSGDYAIGNIEHANMQIQKTIRLTMFIALPSMVGMSVLAYPIMNVLFPASSPLASQLLLFGSLYVLAASLSTITGSVLQSIGKQKAALYNAAISLGGNLVLLAILLFFFPSLGIYAVMISSIFFSVSYGFFNTILLRKYLGFRNEVRQTYLIPLLSAVGMGIAAFIIYILFHWLTKRAWIGLLVSIPVAALVYFILFISISGTKQEEMIRYPFGTKIVRVMQKLRIYR